LQTSASGNAVTTAVAFLLLVAADAVFLWMFLATDPLDQFGRAINQSNPSIAAAAFGIAAEWRHGMAGNSWIYMPGFFLTAAAIWLHSRTARTAHASVEQVAAAIAGLAVAFAAVPRGWPAVAYEFAVQTGIAVPGAPGISATGAVSGGYTLLTWEVFVLACRRALVHKTWRPFVAPAILTGGLALLRPWTVNDFTSHWAGGIAAGDLSAHASLALVLMLSGLLAASERSHRSHNQTSPFRPVAKRRAERTKST
jgi:hypothetical protein